MEGKNNNKRWRITENFKRISEFCGQDSSINDRIGKEIASDKIKLVY